MLFTNAQLCAFTLIKLDDDISFRITALLLALHLKNVLIEFEFKGFLLPN